VPDLRERNAFNRQPQALERGRPIDVDSRSSCPTQIAWIADTPKHGHSARPDEVPKRETEVRVELVSI
jgi:hypothetical protein